MQKEVIEISKISCIVCGSTGLIHKYPYKTAKVTKGIFMGRSLISCPSCTHIQVAPMPTEIELNEYYSHGDYWENEGLFSKNELELIGKAFSQIAYIDKFANLENIVKVLDIGAGYGVFFHQLKTLFPDIKYQFTAVESDPAAIAHLKKNFDVEVLDDYRNIDDKFDLIVASHFIEHIPNPRYFMKALIKMLNPKGICFIEVPNKDYIYKKNLIPHISFFSVKSLSKCSAINGLKILSKRTVGQSVFLLDKKKDNSLHLRVMKKMLMFYDKLLSKRIIGEYRDMFVCSEEKKQMMLDRGNVLSGSAGLAGQDRRWIQIILTI